MTPDYSPRSYWEERLSHDFSLRGVGHRQFDERYNRWLYRAKQQCLVAVLSAQCLVNRKVLDVGSGTGVFVRWYLERGATVHGLDITDTSVLQLTAQFPNATFTSCDISDQSFLPPGQFDIINIWDVLYHIVDDSAWLVSLENVARCCEPGALVLITDCLGAPHDQKVAGHVKFRCLETYTTALKRLGFQHLETRFLYCYLNHYSVTLGRLNKHLGPLLGPLLYWLDRTQKRIPADNLSLGIWSN